MTKKTMLAILATTIMFNAFAQDSTKVAIPPPATTFSGSVDFYYRYNFNDIQSFHNSNNYTSFTNSQNSFELGMATIRADHSFGKVSATADLGFGRRSQEFSYNDNAFLANIKQMYLTYSPRSDLKFTMGKWATHFDCEVPDVYLDRNYSMSYVFSYGPFFHTGIKAEFTKGKSTFMLGVANPTDYTTTVERSKYIIAQFASGTKDDKLKFYLNYQGGKSNDSLKVNAVNLTAIYAFCSKFNIVSNSSVKFISMKTSDKWKADNWWGSALYLNYDPKSWFGLTLRSEYFNDDKNLNGIFPNTGSNNIFENTLSANFKINSLTIVPEFRFESSSQKIYSKKDGTGLKGTGGFLLAAYYKF